ncbi:MAG: AAA family ATPase [Candidatus Binatia bacterium]
MRDRLVGERIRKSKQSILLLGPRQVGKSTLCRALEPGLYIDLADQATFLAHSKDAGLLRRELAAHAQARLVVIDEAQRVPTILNTVQSLIDASGKRLRFIITGSSARKLKRGGANLLPGRLILERLDPLSIAEIRENADLTRCMQLGMLPGIYDGGHEAIDVLGTYADVYLREEVQAEALTTNIGAYARFLDTIAAASGQWINYSKLASDAEIPKETLRRFIQLLDDTLLCVRIPPYRPAGGTSRKVQQRERVLLFDVGVRNALLGTHRRHVAADQAGSVFEQWVILQVVYLEHALRAGWRLSTYRSEAGAEVDLIIERDDDVLAVEIKHGAALPRSTPAGCGRLPHSMADPRSLCSVGSSTAANAAARFDDGVEVWPVLDGLRALQE